MAPFQQISFPSSTGVSLQGLVWRPEGHPRGVVQIVHGMAEHIRRYNELAQTLAREGFVVAGHNHLGHGDGAKVKGLFSEKGGWDALLADIHLLRKNMEKEHAGLPYFLLGHSMGSFLTRCYLMDCSAGLAGAVLSGTGNFQKAEVNAGLALAKGLILLGRGAHPAKVVDKLAFSGNNKPFKPAATPFDWLSRDEKQVQAYVNDPLCGFVFTALGYRDLFTGLKRMIRAGNLKTVEKELPLLFLSGGSDPVGKDGAGVRRAADSFIQAGLLDVTVKMYPKARHEIFNEVNRQEVYADLTAWLKSRFSA